MEPRPQSESQSPSSGAESWLAGGGEMGKAVRQKDWSTTALGPIETWPQSLRTTVSLCLSSNFPISIAWGPQRIQIYNDGYWPICAAKHPHSLGQDFKQCWFSAWPVIGEAFEQASRGETTFLVNQRMFLDRLGYLEETFFTFSFSPIRDESGDVGGLFHPVTELTQQSLAERRLRVLRDVADRCAEATSIEGALTLIADKFTECELDIPFALLYRLESDGTSMRLVRHVGIPPGEALTPQRIALDHLSDGPWPCGTAVDGPPVLVHDLARKFGSARVGPYEEPPDSAVVHTLQLPGMARPFGFLIAGVSSRRPLDEAYRTFYDMLGDAVTNALAKARAYEEERARAETLAELDRAKTVFFSNVSHEFRTPLTLMLGPAEELLSGSHPELSASVKDQLEVINRNGLRLLRLVNSLLDFSRMESGRAQASFEQVDLAALTVDLASSFRSATERANLHLVVECQPIEGEVYVDRDMWEKIVLNLISNAFKFTFKGEITVTLRQAGRTVELHVRDTGVGISDEDVSKIFDRFHRVENVRSRTHEGSGIGLALVKELVHLHGGTVRVESRLNAGSTFIVTLPVGLEHLPPDRIMAKQTQDSTATGPAPFVEEALRWVPEPASRDAEGGRLPVKVMPHSGEQEKDVPSAPSAEQPSPLRILLVDDNADMRDYVSRILSERYEVRAVTDGEAALAALDEDQFHLVLSDVMMPRLDGFGLLQQLRTNPRTRTLPVILLTARAGEESRLEGLDQGADDYLIKPFTARELVARVDAHLKLQRLRWAAQAEADKFASLTENSSEFIGICDLDYEVMYLNAAGLTMVGIDRLDPTRPVSVTDFFFPEDQAFILDTFFPRVLQEGRAEVEIRFRHFKTGEALWMIYNVFQLRDPQGRVIGLATVSRNITVRKDMEEALKEKEARFRVLTDSMPQQVWSALPDGRLDYINQQTMLYFQRSADRLLGWNWQDVLHPDDVAPTLAVWEEARTKGIPYETQFRLRRARDGMYRWHLSRALPLVDSFGRIVKWFGTNTDITDAKQAEAALRKSEERFRQIFEHAATGIVITDMEGQIMQCNPAFCTLLEYPEQDLLGRSFATLVHPEDREINLLDVRRLMADEIAFFETEIRYLRKDGQSVWVHKFVSVLRDEAGRPAHKVALVTDITDRKERETQLRRGRDELEVRVQERTRELLSSQDRLRSLASQLSLTEQRERRKLAADLHDYLAQLLVVGRMKLEQGKQMFAFTTAASRIVKDVDNILEQALAYSRTTIAELSPPVLQEAGLTAALQWLAEQMQKHGLSVQVDSNDDPVHLPEDRAVLLYHSVRELLFNVLKHAGVDQASVRIRAEQDGNVCISVEDRGKGCDATVLTQTHSPGHLGLSAVRERMDAMGGRVELDSEAGKGTQVQLILPVSWEPVEDLQDSVQVHETEHAGISHPSILSPDSTPPSSTSRIRIILVDDHAMVRKALRSQLERYEDVTIVGETGDGAEAVTLAGRLLPDVMVMDCNIQTISGIEATRQITQKMPGIKVIGLTFHETHEMRTAMMDAGAVDALQKTGVTEDLYQAIRAACTKPPSIPAH